MALYASVSSTVGDIFKQYLKELAIAEFPRGNGNWRNDLKWESDLLESTKDVYAELFTVERLLELSYQKPFHKEIEWSSDAKLMHMEAIKYPNKTKLENIHRKFKSLRIVNKNIDNVDDYISKFESLEELILSTNKIKSLNPKILPRGLRTLELCGNELNDNIGCLCNSPPSHLQHIGLSYNGINTFSDFIPPTRNCWNSLLSLDLSYNNLQNLFQVVDVINKLPKLRNLVLVGNPLYWFIGYRGYIIDSVKTLAFLDEANISAHEKHLYKGMSRIKHLPTSDFCVINLKLDNFNGKIRPEVNENSEEVIRTFVKYHIELTFMKDCVVIDADDLSSDGDDESNTLLIIPENNNNFDKDNQNKVIKSNEFSFVDEEFEFKLNKYIICKDLKKFCQLISNKMEVRMMQTNVTMSNEPMDENELMPILKTKESSPAPVEKPGKRTASLMKRRDSAKSSSSVPKRAATKVAKPKKSKCSSDDYFELSRTTEVYAAVAMDSRSILEGAFVAENDFEFTPINVPETEAGTEVVNTTHPDRPKKKGGKGSKPPETNNFTKTRRSSKVETIVEESDDMELLQEKVEPPSLHFCLKVIQWGNSKECFDWIQKIGSKVLNKSTFD